MSSSKEKANKPKKKSKSEPSSSPTSEDTALEAPAASAEDSTTKTEPLEEVSSATTSSSDERHVKEKKKKGKKRAPKKKKTLDEESASVASGSSYYHYDSDSSLSSSGSELSLLPEHARDKKILRGLAREASRSSLLDNASIRKGSFRGRSFLSDDEDDNSSNPDEDGMAEFTIDNLSFLASTSPAATMTTTALPKPRARRVKSTGTDSSSVGTITNVDAGVSFPSSKATIVRSTGNIHATSIGADDIITNMDREKTKENVITGKKKSKKGKDAKAEFSAEESESERSKNDHETAIDFKSSKKKTKKTKEMDENVTGGKDSWVSLDKYDKKIKSISLDDGPPSKKKPPKEKTVESKSKKENTDSGVEESKKKIKATKSEEKTKRAKGTVAVDEKEADDFMGENQGIVEAKKRLLEIADKCPVHRTLEGEVKIETSIRELWKRKRQRKTKRIAVLVCMMQRRSRERPEELPLQIQKRRTRTPPLLFTMMTTMMISLL